MMSVDTFFRNPNLPSPICCGWFPAFEFPAFEAMMGNLRLESESIPETMLLLTEDDFGNSFCLGFAGAERNQVYFYDHDAGWHHDAGPYVERNEIPPHDIRVRSLEFVADSFEAFIDGLYLDEQ